MGALLLFCAMSTGVHHNCVMPCDWSAIVVHTGTQLLHILDDRCRSHMSRIDMGHRMTEDEQFKLLSSDGMLVKRPILLDGDRVLVGFREREWEAQLG